MRILQAFRLAALDPQSRCAVSLIRQGAKYWQQPDGSLTVVKDACLLNVAAADARLVSEITRIAPSAVAQALNEATGFSERARFSMEM
jgi:hypothetical protein